MTLDDVSRTQINQIPTDFEAFLNARSGRSGQRKRRGIKLFSGAGTLPSHDHTLDFAHGYYDADPVAEAFVQDAYIDGNSSHGRAMLDQALAHGIDSVPDAPASMGRLFSEVEKDPPWVYHDLVERGAFLFRRCGPAVFSFLGVATLLAYTENPIVQPLNMTGKYAGDAALNRFMETARFWIDVSDPGGHETRSARSRHRHAGSHHARLSPASDHPPPAVEPGRVGQTDQSSRSHHHAPVGRVRRRAGHAQTRLPIDHRRHRGDDALLAICGTSDGRPTPLVPSGSTRRGPADDALLREAGIRGGQGRPRTHRVISARVRTET